MRFKPAVWTLTVLALAIIQPAQTQSLWPDLSKNQAHLRLDSNSDDELQLLGRWPRGFNYTVALGNGKAYFGDGGDLVIADIDTDGALINHRRHTFDGTIRDLVLKGTTLYIANGKEGLRILDVSNPDMPQELSIFKTSDYLHKLQVDVGYAYLLNRRPDGDPFFVAGIYIIDVSNPADPKLADFLELADGVMWDLRISGPTLYVADLAIEGVHVFDIGEPETTLHLATYEIPGFQASALDVAGNSLFLGSWFGELMVLDISNRIPVPAGPNASLNLGNNRFEYMAVYGDLLVMASTSNNLLVLVDVATPDSPAEIQQISLAPAYDSEVRCTQTAMDGSRLYIAHQSGMVVLDFSNPQSPGLIASYPGGGTHEDIWVENDLLYTASGVVGMHIVDVGDPQNIQDIGHLPRSDLQFENYWQDIIVHEGIDIGQISFLEPDAKQVYERTRKRSNSSSLTAFAGLNIGGMAIFDVNDPEDVQLVSRHNHTTLRLAQRGNYLYALTFGNHLVYDISEPASSQQVGSFSSPFFIGEDLFLSDDLLFISHFFDGVSIFSLSSPTSPSHTGTFTPATFGGSVGLAVSGNYLLVTDAIVGILRMVDVSNPAAPVQAGALDLGTGLSAVAVDGQYAYVGGRASGLFLVDISNPLAPVLVDEYTGMAEGVSDIFIDGDRVYVSSSLSADAGQTTGGVYIFRNALATSVVSYDGESIAPENFGMDRNYPNPFNPVTTIPFTLDRPGPVTLSIYNASGQFVQKLVDEQMPAGHHQRVWNANNLSSGVYFFRLISEGRVDTREGLLLK